MAESVTLKPYEIHPIALIQRNGRDFNIMAPLNDGEMSMLMSKAQFRAYNCTRGIARQSALAAAKRFEEKYGENASAVLEFLQNVAPIDIRFPDRILDILMKSPVYKNIFELGSNCDGRRAKEDQLFDGIYGTTDAERPKYGAVNYLNKSSGTSATSYGQCFLRLKQVVKKRCTLTYGNSTGDSIYGNFDHIEHIATRLPEADQIIQIVTGERLEGERFRGPYVEVQIHGSLRIDRDIESVHIPHQFITNAVRNAFTNYGVEVIAL